MNKGLFLDRDGTVIEHVHYLKNADDVRLVDRCAELLTRAREAGYLLIIVSNQSVVGRGMGSAEEVKACNARMEELLREQGVKLDRVAYCPHAPEDDCICRKPKPGMLLDAATELDIDLTQSVMIGDNVTDIEAGENAGCRLSLYLNSREHINIQPAFDSLAEAIEYMLE